MTLIHMATQQPDRIGKLVLISGTTYFPKHCREIMDQLTVDNISEAEWKYYRSIVYGDEQTRMLRQQFHDFKDSYDDLNFTPPLLETIKAETLIVHGDRDPFFPVSIPVSMYESIPKSYLFIVPNFAHDLGTELRARENGTPRQRLLLGIKKSVILDFLSGDWCN